MYPTAGERIYQANKPGIQEEIHEVEARLGEGSNWNAVFKPDSEGNNRFQLRPINRARPRAGRQRQQWIPDGSAFLATTKKEI